MPVCLVSEEIGFKRIEEHYLPLGRRNQARCLSGPEVIKLFLSSAQLQLLINTENVEVNGKFRFKTQKLVIYPAHKC